MKRILIIVSAFAVSVFAADIEVVDCEDIMKLDPPPLDKILSDTYDDIERNANDFICAYQACDFQHNNGWYAIKKDKSVVFHWDKRKNTTLTTMAKYDDNGFSITRVKYDKYGLINVGGLLNKEAHEYQDLLTNILLAPVSECTGVYDSVKDIQSDIDKLYESNLKTNLQQNLKNKIKALNEEKNTKKVRAKKVADKLNKDLKTLYNNLDAVKLLEFYNNEHNGKNYRNIAKGYLINIFGNIRPGLSPLNNTPAQAARTDYYKLGNKAMVKFIDVNRDAINAVQGGK